ncbi:MAG: glycoside hydrolase family 19 protein [Actinomycetota bacterium]|nr:glycoside hydrolase family 19 protein [Actinomycetota bacterium]
MSRRRSRRRPRYAVRLGWRSLRRVVPTLNPSEAKSLARDLGQAMIEQRITTRRRAAMFIAQIAHESAGFRYREEIASGAAYEGRRDLGNTRSGDGRRFKGRTFIQITGRANYRAVSSALGVDFIAHPEKLAHQKYACAGAAWWWNTHGCNALADRGDFTAVTRRINGGTNGLADRQSYYRRARPVARFLTPKRRSPR